jgi:hypothetical protein
MNDANGEGVVTAAGGGEFGGQCGRRQVHVAGGRLWRGVAHQLAQGEQIDPGGSQFGPIGVAEPIRTHPRRS